MNSEVLAIGSAAIWRGPYKDANTYYAKNLTTMCGCLFQCESDRVQGAPPCVIHNTITGDYEFANTSIWNCVLDNLELFNRTKAAIAAIQRADELNVIMAAAIANVNKAKDYCLQQTEDMRYYHDAMWEALGHTKRAVNDVKNAINDLDDFKANVIKIANGEPNKMVLEYLPEISIRNKNIQRIKPVMYPVYCSESALFNLYEGDPDILNITPDGVLEINGTGTATFEIIPTYNTKLWQRVDITVRAPKLRLSNGKLRTANGQLRIV